MVERCANGGEYSSCGDFRLIPATAPGTVAGERNNAGGVESSKTPAPGTADFPFSMVLTTAIPRGGWSVAVGARAYARANSVNSQFILPSLLSI